MSIPKEELARLETVYRYRILDTEREGTFDHITALAASLFCVPRSLVCLVDADRAWFKSVAGFDATEVPRAPGLCEQTIKTDEVHHLFDAKVDPGACKNPLVAADGGIRFYAGVALRSPEGFAIGTLCVFGPEPREFSEDEAAWLIRLGEFTMHEIDSRRAKVELRHTEDALLQAQRLGSIGLVASGVAHDFNNLLGGIIGNVDLLKREVAEDSMARELIDEIDAASHRSAELVSQVLAYAGREEQQPGPVDLNNLVEQTHYLLESVVHENTRLELALTSEPTSINAAATSIRQLVMNLVTNASEAYGGQQGIVRLTTSTKDAQVHLTVSDSGTGISPEVREHMFEPLFSTKASGRGLGLASVKRILDTPGTSINVKSEPGEGTSVCVSIPTSGARAVDSPAAPESAEKHAPEGTILVIDNEQAILDVTRKMLTTNRFRVLCARGGRDALEVLKERGDEISAVILDMSMPEMSGKDTLEELRMLNPGLKVILSSGHTEEQALLSFSDVRIEGFLKKPYGMSVLLETVSDSIR